MGDQFSFSDVDSLLFQLGLQTREYSQKKEELNYQIKVCQADIAEKKLYIKATQTNINKLEEGISVKQNTITHNKANVKSMRTTNSLLLQYEQTLKAELERRKSSFSHNVEVYEERMASYRKTFESHKEYYLQNPVAQKLLMLQAEKEEIEGRLKICDDQITMKQKELDGLTGPTEPPFSTEKLSDSSFDRQPTTEQEKQLHGQEHEGYDSSIDLSFLQLNQTRSCQDTSTEEQDNDENPVQDPPACQTSSEKSCKELWSSEVNEQSQPGELHFEEQETSQQDILEQQSALSDVQMPLEMQKRVATDEEQAPGNSAGPATFTTTSSQETNAPSFPAKMTAVPSTPTFSFSFSPSSSPHQGPSDIKSPAFLFSMNSNPSTPGFAGFGFETGSSQEEESPFAFTGSLFNEKKTSEAKSAGCSEFLFGEPGQREDFQFAFTSESPQPANKDDDGQEFPFPFNF